MQTAQFPASAASTLIEGYCEDFASLASILAQTLEQVSMRGLSLGKSGDKLASIEQGMRDLADAIHDLLAKSPSAAPPAPAHHGANAETAPRSRLGAHARPLGNPAPATPPPAAQAASPAPQPASRPASPTKLAPAAASSVATPPAAAGPTQRTAGGTLRGTTESMPLLSVVQFIGRTRKSGVLKVDLGNGHIAFQFSDGSVCATETSHCPEGERLGDVLVDLGFCKRDDIDTLLRGSSEEPGKRLGDLIMSTGLVSSGQVIEALETQVQRRFQRACTAKDAGYEFTAGPRTPNDGRIMISSFELAYEANRAARRS